MQSSTPKTKLSIILRTITTSAATTSSYQRAAAERGFLTLLQSCNNLSNLLQIHTRILKLGFENNPLILTKFASKSSDLNSIDYAHCFLFSPYSSTHLYDAFLFNTIIKAYAQSGNLKAKALWVFNYMLECKVLPNDFTYPFILKACAGIGDLNLGMSVHGSLLKFGFDGNYHVLNTLVHMYCSCKGGIEFGREVFDEMTKKHSVPWSAMIGGYVRLGRSNDAVDLFRQMQMEGVCPDEITMVAVLCACTDLGALELGRWVESLIEKKRVNKSVELNNALLDMFAKCGDVDKALKLFRTMSEKSIVSWTSVIVGLAMHGRGLQAVSLFHEMIRDGVAPDDVVFIGLLSACSHSGLVEKGKQYFDLMRKEFGILPKIEHYGCMVDMLCRAGLVREAVEFVQKMPIEPNSIVWRTLIYACRTHGELKLGESIARELIENEPMCEANYVLLSNIYAKMFHWEKKTKVREVMDKKGMRKIPGSTMIELNDKIYKFIAGDMSHNQYKEIFEMVDEMGRKLKRAGYVPSTSEVMLDIDEEDKEDNLNMHSEKLAIAFALINTPPGTAIRIVKNLRVCNDCHSVTKLISKIYNREIIARDRNRFHHFKDGLCSCKDFWIYQSAKDSQGVFLSAIGMAAAAAAAAAVEVKRSTVAKEFSETTSLPKTVFGLIPQFILVGSGEAFIYTGQLDFFVTQSPKGMKTMSTGHFLMTLALGFFFSSLLGSIVKAVTGSCSKQGRVGENINKGRLNCFYGLVAALSIINFRLFLLCAAWFRRKAVKRVPEVEIIVKETAIEEKC